MEIKEFRSRGANDKKKKQIILVKNDPSKQKNSEKFFRKL